MNFNIKLIAVRLIFTLLLFLLILYSLGKLGIIQKWLHVNAPIETNLLIVEGWIRPHHHNKILEVYKKSKIEKILITGHPINNSSAYKSNSEKTRSALINLGIPRERIEYIVNDIDALSKTYSLASGAVKWMNENQYSSANILTLSFHSRRTSLSFKKASSKNMQFGVISINSYTHRKRTIKELIGNFLIRFTPKFILEL